MQGNAPTYAVRAFEIAPGASVQTYRQSNFVTCLEATDAFKIAFDGNSANDFEKGLTYRESTGFTEIQIINPSATVPLSVKLAFGKGDVQDARLVVNGEITLSTPQRIINDGIDEDTANLTRFEPEANAAEVWIYNRGAGEFLLLGDPAPVQPLDQLQGGIPVSVGSTFILNSAAPFNLLRPSGIVVRAAIMQILKT